MALLLRNVQIADARGVRSGDVTIINNQISQISPPNSINANDIEIIDCAKLTLIPELVDLNSSRCGIGVSTALDINIHARTRMQADLPGVMRPIDPIIPNATRSNIGPDPIGGPLEAPQIAELSIITEKMRGKVGQKKGGEKKEAKIN